MYTTTFNPQLSNLKHFKTIGYEKQTKTLTLFLNNGRIKTYSSIEEESVFQFLITYDKERFVEEVLEKGDIRALNL